MSASSQAVFLRCKCKTDVGETFERVFLTLQLLTIAGDLKICFRDESGEAKKDGEGNASSSPCY